MQHFSTQKERDAYSRQIAVSRRIVTHKDQQSTVYDVWSMLGDGRWQSVANAMSPRLIKEFFNIDII